MTRHHEIFAHFRAWSGDVPPGVFIDWIGAQTPAEFIDQEWTPQSRTPTEHPSVDEEYFEWVDVLEMARRADHVFTFLEIGAGYGRWSARAVCAARQLGKEIRLGLAEAAPKHIEQIRRVMEVNAVATNAFEVFPYAIARERGEGNFVVEWPGGNAPPDWYGQALTSNSMAGATVVGEHEGLPLWRMADGWGVIRIPQVPLSDIVARYTSVDLVDLDVQGAEAGAVEESIHQLNTRVRRLHIGTHSHDIEAQLRKTLSDAGWECVRDFPCAQENDTPVGRVTFIDGVQTWDNPKLA